MYMGHMHVCCSMCVEVREQLGGISCHSPKDKTQVVIPDSWYLYPSHPPLNLSVSMTDFSISSTKHNEPLGKFNRWLWKWVVLSVRGREQECLCHIEFLYLDRNSAQCLLQCWVYTVLNKCVLLLKNKVLPINGERTQDLKY